MIKSISSVQNTYYLRQTATQPVAFKSSTQIKRLAQEHIGNCQDGLIGTVKVRLANNEEKFLNLFKRTGTEIEEYKICDDFDRTIGEVQLKIKKFINYDKLEYPTDPSHVFVDNLRNYSKPQTPYHNKDLTYYKDIGTRFLQIALKRSQESGCNGNIKLIAKNESMPFYKNVIHMQEAYPKNSPLRFFNNPNTLYLPEEFKNELSNIRGGL